MVSETAVGNLQTLTSHQLSVADVQVLRLQSCTVRAIVPLDGAASRPSRPHSPVQQIEMAVLTGENSNFRRYQPRHRPVRPPQRPALPFSRPERGAGPRKVGLWRQSRPDDSEAEIKFRGAGVVEADPPGEPHGCAAACDACQTLPSFTGPSMLGHNGAIKRDSFHPFCPLRAKHAFWSPPQLISRRQCRFGSWSKTRSESLSCSWLFQNTICAKRPRPGIRAGKPAQRPGPSISLSVRSTQ